MQFTDPVIRRVYCALLQWNCKLKNFKESNRHTLEDVQLKFSAGKYIKEYKYKYMEEDKSTQVEDKYFS